MKHIGYSRSIFNGGLLRWASALASVSTVLACGDATGQAELKSCPASSGGSTSTDVATGGTTPGENTGFGGSLSVSGGTESTGPASGGISGTSSPAGGTTSTDPPTENEGGVGGTPPDPNPDNPNPDNPNPDNPNPDNPNPDNPNPDNPNPDNPNPDNPNPDNPAPGTWTSICEDAAGAPIPYDFSRGIVGEYAFELAMSCDVGGYLSPLVAVDPIGLTGVDAYVNDLTAWLRGRILVCDDGSAELPEDEFALVPPSQLSGMSNADFVAVRDLFLSVVSRHDGLIDGINPEHKAALSDRISSYQERTVSVQSNQFTRTLSPPDCFPSQE